MRDKEAYRLRSETAYIEVEGMGNAVTWIDWKHVRGVKRSFWLRFIWPVGDRPYFFVFKRYWKISFWPKRKWRQPASKVPSLFDGGPGAWDKDNMLTPTKYV